MSNSFLQVHYYLKFSKAIGYQEHVWFSKIPQEEPAGKVCLVTCAAVDVMGNATSSQDFSNACKFQGRILQPRDFWLPGEHLKRPGETLSCYTWVEAVSLTGILWTDAQRNPHNTCVVRMLDSPAPSVIQMAKILLASFIIGCSGT